MAWKSWAVGCAFTAASMAAQPLTLGKERGAAWIGQPLELLVAVQLDPGENEVCAQADVFHADSRQDPARVRVTVEPGNVGESRILRINSATLVDEPVVSVYLSVGCSQKSTRKYVLLADFPNSPQVPMAPLAPLAMAPNAFQQSNASASERAVPLGGVTPPTPSAESASTKSTSAPQTAALATPTTDVVATLTSDAPNAPSASEAPARPKKAPPAAYAKAAKATAPGKPRLQLDPIDTVSERAQSLQSGAATPAVRDSERIARLQQDVRALLEQAAKTEASLLAVQAQLLQSQTQSAWPAGLVYALMVLTLGSLAGMAFMWMRGKATRG